MKHKEPYNIKTYEELSKVLETIDKEMRESSVPIQARQIKGWLSFSSRFGLGLSMSEPLSQTVMNWFEERYGDKLKVDYAIGEVAVMIRGDLYKMRIPKFYGQIEIICDPRFWMEQPGTQIAVKETDPLPKINVLNFIEGLTENYALTLTLDEQRVLFHFFLFGCETSLLFEEISGVPFINEAKGDIQASVAHLFERQPQFGLSKWASLQAAEKFLKAYLSKKGITPPFTHDLQKLASLATLNGLPPISSAELAKIQCTPSVRYGNETVSAQEAVTAHHMALKLCLEVAEKL